jgi:hypothetical protein
MKAKPAAARIRRRPPPKSWDEYRDARTKAAIEAEKARMDLCREVTEFNMKWKVRI